MSSIATGEGKKVSYLRQVQNELRKVSWTSREELFFCTKVVILSTFVFGLVIYGVDLVIHGSLDGIRALFQMLFG